MRKSKFTDSQIVAILKEGDSGIPVRRFAARTGSAREFITSGRANLAASQSMN